MKNQSTESKNPSKEKNRKSLITAAVALVICLGPFCPIEIQDALCIMAGCVLGMQGAGAVGLYIVLGMLGLPVLEGYTGGTAALTGITGGFIWGEFLAALLCGLIMGSPFKKKEPVGLLKKAQAASESNRIFKDWKLLVKLLLVIVAANVVVQVPGIFWQTAFTNATNISEGKPVTTYLETYQTYVLPKLTQLIIKMAISYPIVVVLRKKVIPYFTQKGASGK